MVKHLTKHGNSMALVLDKSILELLGITAETPLSLTTDGQCLIVTPATSAGRGKRLRAALAKVNRNHGRALKRLAE